jgi:DnaJ-class molecular chaperone
MIRLKLPLLLQILSDTQKKSIYDKFGVAGLNGANRGSRSSASDMAREFFKGFGAFSVPLVFQLDLSLEDFYLGKEITIPIDSSQQVKVVVEPGMFGGQELIAQAEYRGMAREIILRLREIRHPVFLRKNADLLIDINISLAEALLGFKRTIRLLDGKEVTILSPAGEISGPDTVYIIASLGMPVYRTQQEVRGRLFVRSKLEMPKTMRISDPNEINELRRLLSKVDGSSEPIGSKYSHAGISELESDSKSDNHWREVEGAVELITADIRSFGQFGNGPDDDDDDFQRNPFAQYFFR